MAVIYKKNMCFFPVQYLLKEIPSRQCFHSALHRNRKMNALNTVRWLLSVGCIFLLSPTQIKILPHPLKGLDAYHTEGKSSTRTMEPVALVESWFPQKKSQVEPQKSMPTNMSSMINTVIERAQEGNLRMVWKFG